MIFELMLEILIILERISINSTDGVLSTRKISTIIRNVLHLDLSCVIQRVKRK